ncbi:portal protein [Spartinivicinus marinus]|uniref:portal protein n=1 Tax=Spartinivicinus marinus TaxID=2994442 RepID=UPI002250C2B0|nr:portal protein [Spartinivicinus marinus]MCX4024755.1 portal protein [Spartinivicinus marinus]
MELNKSTAKGRYEKLKTERGPFLERARKCAELTIPTLVPPEGATGHTNYATPYQSIGARALNYLAARFLLTLLPPNAPFFRLKVDDEVMKEVNAGDKGKVEQALSAIERQVMDEIEQMALRVACYEALKHLVGTGNALLYMDPKDNKTRVFHLSSYVISRDPLGNVLEIITHETLSPSVLPEKVLMYLAEGNADKKEELSNQKTLNLYRHIKRVKNQWVSYEEINGKELPNTRAIFPLDGSPWLPLRFTTVDGESYGRSYAEQYYGDLHSLEKLSKAIVEGSVAASKVLLFVRPDAVTKRKDIQEAPNGETVRGDVNDVGVLQLNKFADFRVASDTVQQLTQRIAAAFLMNSSVQRDAERVTAEEIRFMAQELETALGGVYSILSQEFQLPIVKIILKRLQRKDKIPPLFDKVRPFVTTGIEALGRGQDLDKLTTFLRYLEVLGQETIARELNLNDYMARLAASIGIDTKGLIKSADQKAEEAKQQQEAMSQQMMQQAALNAAGPVANNLTKGE